MKRTWAVELVVLAALMLLPGVGNKAVADAPQHPTAILGKAYPMTLGQVIAGTVSSVLQTVRPIDAPMMAIYNGAKIEVWICGARSSVEGAKETVEEFRRKATPTITRIARTLYGVSLGDDQITVVYMNRGDNNQEVLRWESGEYVVK